MISYAQRGEDTTLWKFFADKTDGHYIDVGAHDPVVDSVSKSFYDAGWRGVNVEPLPDKAAALRDAQPDSVTVEAALSDKVGEAMLRFDTGRSGLSTLDEENAIRAHLDSSIAVLTMTLAEVCNLFAYWPIDWLKIDVEGWEEQVIRGGDWDRFRPEVVVVEATIPMTKVPSHANWEPLLIDVGYRFVRFDGLNRWYAEDS